MPEIVVVDTRNPQETKTINLAWETEVNQEYIIGRDPSCDLVLDDILIGRIHGKFGLREGNFYYCDLGSKNGSKINNILAKPDQEYFLKSFDTITLGNHLLWMKAISSVGAVASSPNIPKTSVPETSVSMPPPAMNPSTPPTEGYEYEEEFCLEESEVVNYEDEEFSFEVSPDLEFSFEVEEEFEIYPETSMSSPIQSPWDDEDEENYSIGSPPDIDIAEEKSSQILTSSPNIPQSANKILYRYPYLECPDRLPIDQEFSLYVQILIQAPEPKIEAIAIEDRGKPEEPPELEIVLRARGFDLKGSNTKTIQIDRNDDTEERFVLTPRQLGEQQIRVDFYQHDKRIGTTRRNVLIGVMDDLALVEIVQPQIDIALEIKNQLVISPPDLELCIELDRRDRKTLYFTLHSTKPEIDYHHKKVGQITLEDTPEAKILSVYQELNQLAANLSRKLIPLDSENRAIDSQNNFKIAEERIISVGNKLWEELIPDALKQEYWKFKDSIKSLLITSDEPWIPWEMIKPYDLDRELEDVFWCEQFALSRWLSGPSTADEFDAESVITVAPNNSNLPNVKKELDFLNQLDNLRSQISSVLTIDNGLTLKEYIKNNSFSILHFACHGMFDRNLPNDSAIQLTNDSLRPSDIKIKFKKVRPLIFINACHGGRVGFSFTNIGGWAKRFVNARVGIFIGAMWEVNDELAYQFAETFYTLLLRDNLTIAESFQKSRQVIRKLAPYNSTWLAYSLYADPEAKIRLPNQNNLPNLPIAKPSNQILNYLVCHNCDHQNPTDGKFCTQCGSKLIQKI